jgi:hypothetical protein
VAQIDPWEKAAECVRAIQISNDPHQKDVLSNLQQMWIALANQRNLLTQEQRAREAEKIGRLHAPFGSEGHAANRGHYTEAQLKIGSPGALRAGASS